MTLLMANTVRAMAVTAYKAIENRLRHGSSNIKSSPRTEVGFVAAVTLGAVDGIANSWKSLLAIAGYSLRISGVFCHSAPMVRFGQPASTTCELADLLIVVDSLRSGGAVRTASLIQAKMASKAQRVELKGASSIRQLRLYQSWPRFTFVDPGYGRDGYDLRPRHGEDAGMFGIIDRHFKNSPSSPPHWTQHSALPTPAVVRAEPTLGEFMAEMAVANRANFGRRAHAGGSDDWSKVVDLLLTHTYAKTFRHKPVLGDATPRRGSTGYAYFLTALSRPCAIVAASGPSPPYDGIDIVEEDNPRGISVVHFALAEAAEHGSRETG
jgi:hypothetical protein